MIAPATLSRAVPSSTQARLMYELADRTERIVTVDRGDGFSLLTAMAWFLNLPNRPAPRLDAAILLPSERPYFLDTSRNLHLAGVSASMPAAVRRQLAIPEDRHPVYVDLLSATSTPAVPVSICTHDVIVVHQDVTHFRPDVLAKLKAAKVILLREDPELAAQATRLLSSRPRRMELDIPFELILVGAA